MAITDSRNRNISESKEKKPLKGKIAAKKLESSAPQAASLFNFSEIDRSKGKSISKVERENKRACGDACTGCGACERSIEKEETSGFDFSGIENKIGIEVTQIEKIDSKACGDACTNCGACKGEKNEEKVETRITDIKVQNITDIPIIKTPEKTESPDVRDANLKQDIQKEIAIKIGEDTVSNVKSEFVQDDNATRTNPTNLSALETSRVSNTKTKQETESNAVERVKPGEIPAVKRDVKTNESDIKLQSFATNKKQTIIGDYTYEDILTIPWLRKLYGHIIVIIDIEEKEIKKDYIRVMPEYKKE